MDDYQRQVEGEGLLWHNKAVIYELVYCLAVPSQGGSDRIVWECDTSREQQ